MGSIICINCEKRHIMVCPDCGRKFCRRSHGQKWCPLCAKVNTQKNWKVARLNREPTRGYGRGGEHNGGWKGGISGKWARHHKKDKCEGRRCNATEGLEVHHKDENPRNNIPENLQTLCKKCHDKTHMRERMCQDCEYHFVGGPTAKRCPPCRPIAARKWAKKQSKEKKYAA